MLDRRGDRHSIFNSATECSAQLHLLVIDLTTLPMDGKGQWVIEVDHDETPADVY